MMVLLLNLLSRNDTVVKKEAVKKDFNHIPTPLLIKIFNDYLDTYERMAALLTCRLFRDRVKDTVAYNGLDKLGTLLSNKILPSIFTHPFAISSFSYDPHSELIFTGDESDYTAGSYPKIWTLSGKIEQVMKDCFFFKSIDFTNLDIKKKKALAASGSTDSRIALWQLDNEKHNVLWAAHPFPENLSCTYSNFDTNTIICGSWKGELAFLDITNKNPPLIFSEKHKHKVDCIQDSVSLNRTVSFSWDRTLKIWNRNDRTCLATFDKITLFNENCFVPSENILIAGQEDNKVLLINPTTLKLMPLFSGEDETYKLFGLHYDIQTKCIFAGFTFTKEGRGRSKLIIYDLNKMEVRSNFVLTDSNNLCIIPGKIDYDPDSDVVLIGGYSLELWNAKKGKMIKKLEHWGTNVNQFTWDKRKGTIIVLTRPYNRDASGQLSTFSYASRTTRKQEQKEERKDG